MKKRGVIILFSTVICALFFSFAADAADLPEFDDSSVIVATNPDYPSIRLFSVDSAFENTLASLGITDTRVLMNLSDGSENISLLSETGGSIIKLTLPEAGEDKVLEAVDILNASGTVKYAEPNYYYYLDAVPDESEYSPEDQQKNYRFDMINANAVWNTDIDCSGVAVAVIDSGLFMEHEDIKDNIWTNPDEIPGNGVDDDKNGYTDDVHGWDFTGTTDNIPDDGYDPEYDLQGHGTHVSGIIGAVTGNGTGIASLAGNIHTGSVKIVPLKIFYDYKNKTGTTKSKTTTVEMIVDAFNYVKKEKIPIANCSWSGKDSSSISDAIRSCTDTLFVAAAGNSSASNDSSLTISYPAQYKFDNIISVGACDSNGDIADFSNYGTSVDIAAPGVNIWSCANTDLKTDSYKYLSGTSQAAPLVASMAAVLKGKYPSLSPYEIKDCLKNGGTISTSPSKHEVNANRRLDAEGALIWAKSFYCEIIWEDDDGNVIDRTSVEYDAVPSHAPAEKKKDKYEYTFERWDPEPSHVTEDTVYKAVFSKKEAEYTVTWHNGETILKSEKYKYDEEPAYTGETPSQNTTAEYTYEFKGWIPDIAPVTEDTDYYAGFEAHKNVYPITWLDADGSELAVSEAEYGSLPVFPDGQPSKEPTDEFEYVFDGWSPELTLITGPAEYKAKYREKKREYTIIWKNYNGDELLRERIEYGETPEYLYDTPVKPDTPVTHYTFSGWLPKPVSVTGDAEYTAQFTETLKNYTITWKDENGNIIETDKAAYGEIPEYKGVYGKKAPDGYYVYIPAWEPDVTETVGDAEYTMKYIAADMLETSVLLKDSSGYVVRKGGSASKINASVEFPNAVRGLEEEYAPSVEPFTVILAVYDENGALTGVSEKAVNGSDMLGTVDLSADLNENKTINSVRLFIWNKTSSMLPLRNAKDVL